MAGTVDEKQGETLAGENILEKGTTSGVRTNFDGSFQFSATDTNTALVFSYLDFLTQEVPSYSDFYTWVALEVDIQGLDKVVVSGFGTQYSSKISRSVASLDLDEVLGGRSITSTLSSLQRTTPGLTVFLGDEESYVERIEFNTRGTTSINGGDPLVLVDNLLVAMTDIRPMDIKTVKVFKDVVASSIYGTRGAFGVILITGKNSESVNLRFSYNLTTFFSRLAEIWDNASPPGFLAVIDMWRRGIYCLLCHSISTWKVLIEDYRDALSSNPSGYTDEDGYAITDSDLLVRYNINTFQSVNNSSRL
ncbi:MAG: carboxypeptidase-like regulatory domain-containing protein [Flavobacteriaceae bacterium]|nr:carboxypeptidase-like regulatory domain-containing protein [Flavobacteriaceae bacterium]